MNDGQEDKFIGAPRQPKSNQIRDHITDKLGKSLRDKVAILETKNKQLREAYERDCTPAFEEVCMRNQQLTADLAASRAECERLREGLEIQQDCSDMQREIAKAEWPSNGDPRFTRWLGDDFYEAPEVRLQRLNEKRRWMRIQLLKEQP